MDWKKLLAYISGSVDQELLLKNQGGDPTVGKVLKRHGITPAPEREKTTTYREFIRSHMDLLAATDLFTTEVWTRRWRRSVFFFRATI